jgi:hypothetical protein
MTTAADAKLQYEAGQDIYDMSALVDSGDATTFTSSATLFSQKSGYTPDVRPDGLITGGVVTVGAGNDNVSVAALTCYLAGIKHVVNADTTNAITRPATNVAKICSVTITEAGAIVVVAGTDSATTAFSADRAAAGGPPHIDVGHIEIAQVKLLTSAAAPITAAEIFQVPGLHQERYDYPMWTINNDSGTVTFTDSLGAAHTGDLPKGVFASYAEPIFADLPIVTDFAPAETSHSVSSKAFYGVTIGSSSSSLSQGKFTAILTDGISDQLVQLKNQTLWFKFFPSRYKTNYLLTLGKLGITRTFPAGDNIQAACTISSETAAIEVMA